MRLDKRESTYNKKNYRLIVNMAVLCFIMHYIIVNSYDNYLMRVIPTDWKNVSNVTYNDSYYISINVDYPFAAISMTQNSEGYIYGINETGELYCWNESQNQYSTDIFYNTAEIGAVSNVSDREILSVTARRANMNFANPYILILYDKNGEELARVKQKSDPARCWMDFMLEEPISGVYSVAFYDEQGNSVYVCDGLQIGVVEY